MNIYIYIHYLLVELFVSYHSHIYDYGYTLSPKYVCVTEYELRKNSTEYFLGKPQDFNLMRLQRSRSGIDFV